MNNSKEKELGNMEYWELYFAIENLNWLLGDHLNEAVKFVRFS